MNSNNSYPEDGVTGFFLMTYLFPVIAFAYAHASSFCPLRKPLYYLTLFSY